MTLRRVLAGLCSLIMVVLIVECARISTARLVAEPSRPGTVAATVAPPIPMARDPRDYRAIGERSLFNPERRAGIGVPPADAPAAAGAGKRPEPGRMVLAGIAISEGQRLAIIESEGGKSSDHLALGDQLSGWMLVDVQTDSVIMKKGSEIMKLEVMVKKSQPKAKRQAAATAAAGETQAAAAEKSAEIPADTLQAGTPPAGPSEAGTPAQP